MLLLREVLGFSAQETADVLDITVAAVTSRLQRARVRVRSRLPDESQRNILRRLDDRRLRALVAAYVDAWEAGEVVALRGEKISRITALIVFEVTDRELDRCPPASSYGACSVPQALGSEGSHMPVAAVARA